MKKLTLIFFFTIEVLFLYAQKRNSIWMLGGATAPTYPKTKIDFNSGFPDTSTVIRYMEFFITNSGICDTSGQLLMYSNGDYIENRNFGNLLNSFNFNPTVSGDSLHGSNGVQTVLFLPKPGREDQYLIFHVNGEYFNAHNQSEFQPFHLWTSLVDINLDGGLGGIVSGQKTIPVINDSLLWGRITACKHANGRDWWILMHRYYSDLYYKVLVTPDTMIVSQQTIGRVISSDVAGMACFSPDGNQYAMLSDNNELDVFNFDRCTGDMSLKDSIRVILNYATFGCAFSASSRYLYVTTNLHIFQYDTWANPISMSLDTVALWDTTYSPLATTFFMEHLAPDNKIYITTMQGTDKLHVINDPDIGGVGCNVVQNQVTLPSYNAASLPNSVNYDLGPVVGSICDSLFNSIDDIENNNSIYISPNPATGYYWVNYDTKVSDVFLFEVFDVNGQLVEKRNLYGAFKSLRVDCSNFKSGAYVYRVSRGDQPISSGRLVVE